MGTTTETRIVIAIILIYLTIILVGFKERFWEHVSLNEYEQRYSESQYVWGDRHTRGMSDGEIYTYAGIRYAQGEDVTKIEFSHPPLAKYLYGFSYLIFGSPNWILLPLIGIGLWTYWKISCQVLTTPLFRIVSLVLILIHTAWIQASSATLMDLPMTIGIIVIFYLYLQICKYPSFWRLLYFGIGSGSLFLIKYPFPLLVLYVALLLFGMYIKRIKIAWLMMSVGFIALTYLVGYTSFFWHGQTLGDFLKFEFWRLNWFLGKTDAPKFLFWQMLFTGRYPKWWEGEGDIFINHNWNLYWPTLMVLFGVSWIKKVDWKLLPHKCWLVITILAYMFGASDERFLIPLIPGMALFGSLFLESQVVSYNKR